MDGVGDGNWPIFQKIMTSVYKQEQNRRKIFCYHYKEYVSRSQINFTQLAYKKNHTNHTLWYVRGTLTETTSLRWRFFSFHPLAVTQFSCLLTSKHFISISRYILAADHDWSHLQKPIYCSKKGSSFESWISTWTGYLSSKVWVTMETVLCLSLTSA